MIVLKRPVDNFLKNQEVKQLKLVFGQMDHFAGNMLQLRTVGGRPVLVMSQTAHDSLRLSSLPKSKETYRSIAEKFNDRKGWGRKRPVHDGRDISST
ncbi:MAG: arginine deiminase-related protein [Saprospiraceae bacterium]